MKKQNKTIKYISRDVFAKYNKDELGNAKKLGSVVSEESVDTIEALITRHRELEDSRLYRGVIKKDSKGLFLDEIELIYFNRLKDLLLIEIELIYSYELKELKFSLESTRNEQACLDSKAERLKKYLNGKLEFNRLAHKGIVRPENPTMYSDYGIPKIYNEIVNRGISYSNLLYRNDFYEVASTYAIMDLQDWIDLPNKRI